MGFDRVYKSSLIWVHTDCRRGFLKISADEKNRRLLLRLAHLGLKYNMYQISDQMLLLFLRNTELKWLFFILLIWSKC